MNCETLREAIVDVGRGRPVGPGSTAAVDTHVAHCRSCAGLLARERDLTAGLRALARTSSSMSASSAVEALLMDAFKTTRPQTRWTAARRGMPLAAGILLTVGIGFWLARPQPEDRPGSDVPRSVPAPRDDRVPTDLDVATSTPAPPARTLVTRRVGPKAVENGPRFVTAEGFVPLPAALGLPDFESGEIVRVELPVTSLPAYGLEIAPDVRHASVEADLLVGQDGQARAIRLVPGSESGPQQY